MKIKREIIEEIRLPYFSKTDDRLYAIINERITISVHFIDYGDFINTRIKFDNCVDDAAKATPCTQAEFEAAYIKANDYLSEQFESLRDVKSGTTVDDFLSKI